MKLLRYLSIPFLLALASTTVWAQKLQSVSFDVTRNVVMETPAFGMEYPSSLQWRDSNNDGDAADPGESRMPVAYHSGTDVKIGEVVIVEAPDMPPGTIVRVYGYGMDGQEFLGFGTKTGSEVRSDPLTSTVPLPAACRFYDPYEIDWWLLYEFPDGTNLSHFAGTSFNRMYVTLGDVPSPVRLWESLAELSCRAANYIADTSLVVEAIFNEMKNRDVKRKPVNGYNYADGEPLHYWLTIAQSGFTTQHLLGYKDGRCGAWGEFFWASVKLQNGGGARTEIKPKPGSKDIRILVKEWDIINSGGSTGDPRYPYKLGFDVINGDGIPGQNTPEPAQQLFADHCVYRVGDEVFDVSYGVRHHTSVLYEDASFFGYMNRKRNLRENVSNKEDCKWTDF